MICYARAYFVVTDQWYDKHISPASYSVAYRYNESVQTIPYWREVLNNAKADDLKKKFQRENGGKEIIENP